MILRNLSWLTISQALRLVTGLLVGTWLTRSLGPEQNGVLGTALVIGSLAGFVSELGLRQVLIKEFSQQPESEQVLFGTGVRIMLVLGVVSLLVALAVVWIWQRHELFAVALILYAPLPLQASLVVLSRWDAAQQSQRTAKLALAANLIASMARVGCILAGANLRWAAATIALEAVVVAVVTVSWSLRQDQADCWLKWDTATARRLVSSSLPHFVAHAGTLMLLRADQIMLYEMKGAEEAGIYAAATRLSEIVYACGPVVIMAFMPTLARLNISDRAKYSELSRWLFGVLTGIAYGSILLWLLVGRSVVNLLYGVKFDGVHEVLWIHALACLPYLHGELRSSLLVIEGRAGWSARCAAAGLVMNITLNLWLIPEYGAVGAAWATAVSYSLAWFISSLVVPMLRSVGRLQCEALLAPFWLGRAVPGWRLAVN